MNTRWTAAELAPLLRRLRPLVHLTDATSARVLAGVPAPDRQGVRCFVAPGPSVPEPAALAGAEPWQVLAGALPPAGDTAVHRHDAHAPVVLLGTSGTTGETKLVVHTPSTLRGCVDKITDDLRQPEQLALCPLPLVHAGGLIVNLLTYMRLGSPLLLLDGPDPEAVLDVVQQRRVSYLSVLPALLMAVVGAQRALPRDLSSLQRCVVAGDTLPAAAQHLAAQVLGAEVRQVWGATEAMGSFTHGREPGPVSRPATVSQVRLVDRDGAEVAPGRVGEMLVRGDNVSPGYWGGPGCLRGAPVDGWYRSGDLFRRGQGEDHWLVGRVKDVIVGAGSNIAPAEVEDVLRRHPAVFAALVVGLPDPVLGQSVAALVELDDAAQVAGARDAGTILAQLRTLAAGELAEYKLPTRLCIVAALPRTLTSKVDRRRATALLLAQPPEGDPTGVSGAGAIDER